MRWLALGLVLAGCSSEQALIGEAPPAAVSNPPELEAPTVTDRLVQFPRPAVDILFVVDNSCSMEDEQVALGQNFPVFLDYLLGAGIDYHIGVVSTDTQIPLPRPRGRLIERQGYRWIDEDTNDPASVFAAMTTLGTDGSASELGRGNVYKALETNRDGVNAGFLREYAALHVIYVTDEDDDSADPFTQAPSRQEFVRWMHDLKYDRALVRSHAILNLDDGSCEGEVGIDYIDYATATDGLLYSICEDDWSPFMDDLGVQATGLRQEVLLTHRADWDSIEIEVRFLNEDGIEVVFGPDFWTVCQTRDEDPDCNVVFRSRRNSLVFLDFVPPPQAEILVTYKTLSY